MNGRRARWGSIAAGGVVVAAGFGVAIVEVLQLPKGSIWLVVAVALVVILGIRRATR